MSLHARSRLARKELEAGHPSDFLTLRGIDPAVWEARGCRRYQKGDSWVKEEFRAFLPPTRLGTVARIVNQCGGWVMPKHALPGLPPIPPQLRPAETVVVDGREVWHYHGPQGSGAAWPTFPAAAGTAAGKNLPPQRVMWGARAEAHINKRSDIDYDPETGLGTHNGTPIDVAHKHAPREAKYVLLGEGARIDLHPWARERLPGADVVFFVLEGTPKTDAVLSAGGVAFGVPSVTCWDPRELSHFARKNLVGKTVLVVPDADWATNWQVERQALKVRTLLRRIGVVAYACAPPTEEDCRRDGTKHHKGVDDFLGAGGDLGDLIIDGREPPIKEIWAAAENVLPYQRRSSAFRALENLSLYADTDGRLTVSFASMKALLEVRNASRVLPLLQSIAHTFTVEEGVLDTTLRRTFFGQYTETVWQQRPTIVLHEEYRAEAGERATLRSKDFWRPRGEELLAKAA